MARTRPPALDVLAESAIAVAQSTIENARIGQKLTRAALAKRLGCSPAHITQMLRGEHNLTVRTLARVLGACGYEVEFRLWPIDERRPRR